MNNPVVTEEILNELKEKTKATCAFVVLSNSPDHHDCNPGICEGHTISINAFGFTNRQLIDIAETIARSAGLTLTPILKKDELIK